MRFDVHTVRCHLVSELMQVPHVKEVWHDGSDVVILDFRTGETVSIHLVERYMSLDEIAYIFEHNAAQGIYTMLILWGAMFMPSDGQTYEPDDWMRVLLRLYGGKIYAFDAWREQPFIFPVSFTPLAGRQTFVTRHGDDVNIGKIGLHVIDTVVPGFRGTWGVARFDGFVVEKPEDYWDMPAPSGQADETIRYYLNLLGLDASASREEAKAAYRDMARQHHPDRNRDEDTTLRMQRINDAYVRILRFFEAEDQ